MSKNNQKVKYKGFQSIYVWGATNTVLQQASKCPESAWIQLHEKSSILVIENNYFLFCKNCFYLQTRKSRWSQTACVHHFCSSIIVVILKKTLHGTHKAKMTKNRPCTKNWILRKNFLTFWVIILTRVQNLFMNDFSFF